MPIDPIAALRTALEKAREASVTAGWARGPDNRYVATETAAWQQVTDALAAVKRERCGFREALESAVSEIELIALSMPVGNKRRVEMQERNQERRRALQGAPDAP